MKNHNKEFHSGNGCTSGIRAAPQAGHFNGYGEMYMTTTYVNWGEAKVKLTWRPESQCPQYKLINIKLVTKTNISYCTIVRRS